MEKQEAEIDLVTVAVAPGHTVDSSADPHAARVGDARFTGAGCLAGWCWDGSEKAKRAHKMRPSDRPFSPGTARHRH